MEQAFESDFPNCATMYLRHNYRSGAGILSVAEAVLGHEGQPRLHKVGRAAAKGGVEGIFKQRWVQSRSTGVMGIRDAVLRMGELVFEEETYRMLISIHRSPKAVMSELTRRRWRALGLPARAA
eukprot:364836-Chlamydomonas_euryale.AAC.17